MLIRNAIDANSDEDGWAELGSVGSNIVKQAPDFDPRNYGYKKLGELVKATELFDIDERPIGNGRTKAIYIKSRKKKR